MTGVTAPLSAVVVSITNRDEKPVCYFGIDSGRHVILTRRGREIAWAQQIPHLSVRGSRCVMIAPGETHRSEQNLALIFPDARPGDEFCRSVIVSLEEDSILEAHTTKVCEAVQ
jgi:hypothetical protein